jgi:hypothetical protein
MNAVSPAAGNKSYTFAQKPQHNIHKSATVAEFRSWFERETNCSTASLVDGLVRPEFGHAIFVAGSLPMGLATGISDIDFIVLVASSDALLRGAASKTNNASALAFSNESDPLSVGHFIHLINGVEADINIVLVPKLEGIYQRLRLPGPELTDGEIVTLGRLQKAWLLHKTEGFFDNWQDCLSDPALNVYCTTRYFWMSLKMLEKARKAASLQDFPVASYLARLSAECGFYAYFSSKGYCSLGTKWLKFAEVFDFGGSTQVKQSFNDYVRLIFPKLFQADDDIERHFEDVVSFINFVRKTIESDIRYKIAFAVCPQIYPL